MVFCGFAVVKLGFYLGQSHSATHCWKGGHAQGLHGECAARLGISTITLLLSTISIIVLIHHSKTKSFRTICFNNFYTTKLNFSLFQLVLDKALSLPLPRFNFQRVANFRDLAAKVPQLRPGKLFRSGHFAAALDEVRRWRFLVHVSSCPCIMHLYACS